MRFSKGKQLRDKLLTLALIAVLVGVMWIFKFPCPFRFLFHIPCPGCGMTRAYVSLLQLDIVGAFQYHYAFWAAPILFLQFMTDNGIFKNKTANTVLSIVVITAFLVNWIIRLAAVILPLFS